jgi:hypothetical protein
MQLSIKWIAFFSISVFFSTLNAYAQSGKLPGLKGTVSYLEKQLKALPCKTNFNDRFSSTEVTGFKLTAKNKIQITEKLLTIDQHNEKSQVDTNTESILVYPRMPKFSYKLNQKTFKHGDTLSYDILYGCYEWRFYCENHNKCIEGIHNYGKSDYTKEPRSKSSLYNLAGFVLSGNEADQERIKRALDHLFSLMEKKEKQQESADPFAAPTSKKEPKSPTVIDEPTDSNVIILD